MLWKENCEEKLKSVWLFSSVELFSPLLTITDTDDIYKQTNAQLRWTPQESVKLTLYYSI